MILYQLSYFNSFFTYKNDVEVREPEFCTYIITKLTYITKVNRRQHGKSSTLAKSKIRLNIHHQLCLFCSWLHNYGFPMSEKQKQRKSLQSGHPGFTTLHCLILCIISCLATPTLSHAEIHKCSANLKIFLCKLPMTKIYFEIRRRHIA